VSDSPAGGQPPLRSSSARLSGERRSSATVLTRQLERRLRALAMRSRPTAKTRLEALQGRWPWWDQTTRLSQALYTARQEGPSEAPYGLVFQLIQKPDHSVAWNLIAFGERHPANERTRKCLRASPQATTRSLPVVEPGEAPCFPRKGKPPSVDGLRFGPRQASAAG
jgi:hypothetical protein